MATVKLTAESKYGYSGQYIARITGRAARVQFAREFVGTKWGKRSEGTTYETDETGLYEECDVDKHGKKKSYALVLPWKDGLRKLYSDTDDALVIAKRLDDGEKLEDFVVLELGDVITKPNYATRCDECHSADLVDRKCKEHPEASTSYHSVDEVQYHDDGREQRKLVYAIRKAGEVKKAAAAATLETAIAAIVDALQALPAPEQRKALAAAKARLFPKADAETASPGSETSVS